MKSIISFQVIKMNSFGDIQFYNKQSPFIHVYVNLFIHINDNDSLHQLFKSCQEYLYV